MSNLWNFIFKIFYITTSFYIILLLRLYPRSRELERGWRLGGLSLLGCLLAAWPITSIAKKQWFPDFSAALVVFSLALEAFCILPQLLLLRQTKVPTVIDSYYLVALGGYRALYICNWITRWASSDPVKPEAVPVIFGVIQTLFYVDFAYVYYTRQRVKLRGGHVIDGDDLGKSWVLSRVLGRRSTDVQFDADEEVAGRGYAAVDGEDDDYETRTAAGGLAGRGRSMGWGKRGISVSADDDILAAERDENPIPENARMADPDELARALSGDEEGAKAAKDTLVPQVINGGEEWRSPK